jgi:hypothetical protein
MERQSDGLAQFGLAQSDKVAPLPELGANVNVYRVKPGHGSPSPPQKRFGYPYIEYVGSPTTRYSTAPHRG